MRTRARKHPVRGRFWGCPTTERLTDAASAAFRRALLDGFVTVTPRTDAAVAAWYNWCEARRPAVVVQHLQHRRARVILDTITALGDLTDAAYAAVCAALQTAGARRSFCGASYAFGTVSRDRARGLASELLAIALSVPAEGTAA